MVELDTNKIITYLAVVTPYSQVQYRGKKRYELSNHLGNVPVPGSDKRIPVCDEEYAVAYFKAEVMYAQDYYPYGMVMPERQYQSDTGYRYGFNGMEKDNETYDESSGYDFGARIYDSRLGRWLSVDPLWKKYPTISPYNFVDNSPIFLVDVDGKIIRIYYQVKDANGNVIKTDFYDYIPGGIPPDNDFVKRTIEAIEYNMVTQIGVDVWTQLINSDGVLKIIERQAVTAEGTDANGEKTNEFVANDDLEKTEGDKRLIGTIFWDPDTQALAYESTSGSVVTGRQSPSTILFHEAGHAQRFDNAQISINRTHEMNLYFYELIKDLNSEYGSTEEERNITKIESVYIDQINAYEINKAKTTGEEPQMQAKRTNHRGILMFYEDQIKRSGVNEADQFEYNEYNKK